MKNRIIAKNRQLDALVQSLLDDMAGFSAGQLNRKPADGGWSAMQTAHHLLLAEEGSLKYLHKKLSAPAVFKRVGLSETWRSFLLQLSLLLPFKFKSPPSANPEVLPENASFDELRGRWQGVREAWGQFFEQLPEELFDKAVYRHPRAGRLGFLHTLGFLSTHLKRHRKQIFKALA